MALSEETVGWGSFIAERAAELSSAAYNRAINNGLSVLVVDGTELVEMSARGPGRVTGALPPKQRVITGRVITVKKSS